MRVKIAKAGYYSGDPHKVGEAKITDIMDIIAYEAFMSDYAETERELNKDG